MHLAAWAKRFRFSPEQLDLPVELLSGGEQARAIMARFMLQPADVFIVDENTNDLDIPTREILEESLEEFSGALVLVTHDRYMLTQVCDQFVGLDGNGAHGLFADYAQWETWLRRQASEKEQTSTRRPRSRNSHPQRASSKKLTYREQQEYLTIEERILDAEAALETCRTKIADPTVATDHLQAQEAYHALKAAEEEVERLYVRWAELEKKREGHHE